MIPDSLPSPQAPEWKVALSQSFRRVQDLLDYCAVDHRSVQPLIDHAFPLRVTRFYASLIEKGNPADPLLLQVLTDVQERQRQADFVTDAVGDEGATVAPGLIHEYAGRVLLTLTGACAIHCRYCFRRHFRYADNTPNLEREGELMAYLASHDDIREVILSGGDPLMVSDEKLGHLINSLNAMPHIRLLRIHSRVLSVLPERCTGQLVGVLQRFNGRVVLVTHINHANEINGDNRRVFRELAAQGMALFNQAVLLKRVNDDHQALADLSLALFDSAITPYYLHLLDKVQGVAHFEVTEARACAIESRLRTILPGYLLPKLVREIPGRSSKSAVHCE